MFNSEIIDLGRRTQYCCRRDRFLCEVVRQCHGHFGSLDAPLTITPAVRE